MPPLQDPDTYTELTQWLRVASNAAYLYALTNGVPANLLSDPTQYNQQTLWTKSLAQSLYQLAVKGGGGGGATIPSTLNLLAGNGSGGISDSGSTPSSFQPANSKLDTSSTVNMPIIVSVKNVTVLTAGAPADIASISIPAWVTRYTVMFGGNLNSGGGRIFAESAAGTLASAAFTIRDAASGAGNAVSNSFAGPSGSGVGAGFSPASAGVVFTSNTVYINQTANSANAGTMSFYLLVVPLL